MKWTLYKRDWYNELTSEPEPPVGCELENYMKYMIKTDITVDADWVEDAIREAGFDWEWTLVHNCKACGCECAEVWGQEEQLGSLMPMPDWIIKKGE